uniref:Sesquiterpene synthase 6 n=1 Tax=Postia placenta (strain ATCC 44394 / Madison 698-R) TaxID=561896 RepID=STS6_POSPM|nr:RecName: Full=Sesquiterpene synthase 6; AltName: Full=Terpene cyclase 6 [Postia placenta Mad-698-R]BBD74520.1 sesquiterpene synthase [Postia placenta Mad-698-R]
MTVIADTSRCFILPDLISYCQFPLRCNPHRDAAQSSTSWLINNYPGMSPEQLVEVRRLDADTLASYCYPDCDVERLRVASDFLAILFHLDDITDTMEEGGTEQLEGTIMDAFRSEGKLDQREDEPRVRVPAKDLWTRFIRNAKPCVQTRLRDNIALFFKTAREEARDRERGVLLDLESYINMRRGTSACLSCFALTEYSIGIELPQYVVDDPIVQALNQSANDLVSWSNDIYSFNNEQAHGIHNMIVILMKSQGLGMQDAIDYVSDLFKQTIDGFMENTQLLPSWGAAVDADVRLYVQGLQDWVVGNLHWSFATERYFGKRGAEIKATRVVELLPKKPVS